MNPLGRMMVMGAALAMLQISEVGDPTLYEVKHPYPDAPPETPEQHKRRLERETRITARLQADQERMERERAAYLRRQDKINGTSLLSKARRAVAR